MSDLSKDDKTLIHQLIAEAYRDRVIGHDAVGYADLYTDNPLWMPPNAPDQNTKHGIQQAAQGLFDMFVFDVKLQPQEIDISGNLAYVFGQVDGTLTPRDGSESRRIQFTAFWLLRKEADEWKIHRQIWNNKPVG